MAQNTQFQIEYVPLDSLRENPNNARTHSRQQVRQIARSIREFRCINPLIVGPDGLILAGAGRFRAAKLEGLTEVPIIRVEHLTDLEARAYMLADNKIAMNAGWDVELLSNELRGLIELDFDPTITGFSVAEIDLSINAVQESSPKRSARCLAENELPESPAVTVNRAGDLWHLGRHKLLCGDARRADHYALLLGSEQADVMFTDPPYNVPIQGHVSGLGSVRHREFAMASGEMTESEFTAFLTITLANAARQCRDGAIAFVCMDWRHMGELLEAGKHVFSELKNVCVWAKKNGGMGAFYRSRHEMVFVFKVGTGPHTNNFGLGEGGRYRTNVWEYAGISSMSSTRAEELEMHPTVKPVALVADALQDCSKRGEIVLDPFGGSGTTLVAAEKCGRAARLIEYDPAYCDTILLRYERLTGRQATLASTGQTFEEVAEARSGAGLGEAA